MTEVRKGSVRVPLLVVLVLAAGCQAASPGPRSGHAASPQERRLQAADGQLYRGSYDAAETAYRGLVAEGVPGAASHLATLLDYEGRFEEAVTQAQAGVALRSDSDSLARLTRALDWAQDVEGAVAAGARAVAARPVEALAHVFYSEALADAGRFPAAARELHSAEQGGGDAYVQAEIDREWANYYRGLGDTQSELNSQELAVKAQPGFPERQLDLIRFDYGNQRPDGARSLSDRMLTAHPHDYRLLVAVADAALGGGDGERAPALYRAAALERPDGAEAALGLAELSVVADHDFNAAHDLLLEALHRSPSSGPLYEYLRYLDLLVLKRDPAADLDPIAPQAPGDLAADRQTALTRANDRRSTLGLPLLREDAALAEAAEAHAYYLMFNVGQQQVSGVGIYAEDRTLTGAVGADPIDRDHHFGYAGDRSVELVDQAVTPGACLQSWIGSVPQRLVLTDREAAAVGFGRVRIGSLSIAVMDVGATPAGSGDAVVYPMAAQTGVPTSFLGNEVPDPLPQGALLPAGYPVTLQVGGAQRLAVTTGRLLDSEGQQVPSYTLAPGSQLAQSDWALVPRRPLEPGARYTAEVIGTIDGKDFSRRWSFTVAAP
jgi:hypothetical protein